VTGPQLGLSRKSRWSADGAQGRRRVPIGPPLERGQPACDAGSIVTVKPMASRSLMARVSVVCGVAFERIALLKRNPDPSLMRQHVHPPASGLGEIEAFVGLIDDCQGCTRSSRAFSAAVRRRADPARWRRHRRRRRLHPGQLPLRGWLRNGTDDVGLQPFGGPAADGRFHKAERPISHQQGQGCRQQYADGE